MKLIIAIVQDYDCDRLLRAISDAGLRATRIASLGGFLRTGNTTVLMGIDDDQIAFAVRVIRSSCQTRVQRAPETLAADLTEWNLGGIQQVSIGGAVIFVTNVSQFVRIGVDG